MTRSALPPLLACVLIAPATHAQTTFELPAPPLDNLFLFDSGFVGGGAGIDFNGQVVTDARVRFSITVDPLPPDSTLDNGAEFFFASVVLPIDTDPVTPGVQPAISIIDGALEGWSGTGTFTVDREITEAIGGIWVAPLQFSAESAGGDGGFSSTVNLAEPLNAEIFNLVVDDGWFITVAPSPGAAGLFAIAGAGAMRRRR